MSPLHRRQLLAGFAGALTGSIAGCNGAGADTEATTNPTEDPETGTAASTASETDTVTASNPETARVRIAHMSPDAPDIVTSIDGDDIPVGYTLPFDHVSDYVEVPAGTHRVTVTETRDDTTLIDRDMTLEDGEYTFVATGEVMDDTSEFRLLPLVDDNTDPGDDTARLRLLHVSTDAGVIDVTVDPGQIGVDGLGFTERERVSIKPDEYTIQVRAETTDDGRGTISTQEMSLTGGSVYTAFVSGYLDVEFASVTSLGVTVTQDAGS